MKTSPSEAAPSAATEECALVIPAAERSRLLAFDENTIQAGITLALAAAERGVDHLEGLRNLTRGQLFTRYGLRSPLPCNTNLWQWEGDTLHFSCIRRIPLSR